MGKTVGVLVVLVALTTAPLAAAKTDPGVLALRRQVTALQAQVKQLQVSLAYEKNTETCHYALQQDSFIIVFMTLSKMAAVLTGQNVPAWEQIPRFDDQGACAAVGVTRP